MSSVPPPYVAGSRNRLRREHVVKGDADTLTKQRTSTCCASPAEAGAKEPAAADGCC
ncbi:hypothetical protein [Streptomyces sp. NPDC101165]|uniref:hypothetical protein n=1 Tax=Streptomyces sp. NPDC101165 TaxID=3366119 RepID=UPI00380DB264